MAPEWAPSNSHHTFYRKQVGNLVERPHKNSHWLYRIDGDPGGRVKFMHQGEMIAEYRGNGCMTVFPGSFHQDTGEAIEWSQCDEPGLVSRNELLSALRKIVITATVLPSYREGSRNDVVNAITGTLSFHGMQTNDIADIINGLIAVTGDDEVSSRLASVYNTVERRRAN
jgi:hypothetical protein